MTSCSPERQDPASSTRTQAPVPSNRGGLIKKKRETAQINKIRNEKGEVTIDTTEIQRIIRDYYEQLLANKMDNLKEMNKFLERYHLLRLNQEKIENMKRTITSNEIESVI